MKNETPSQDSVEDGVTLWYKLMEYFYTFPPTRRLMIRRYACRISRKAFLIANSTAYTNPDQLTHGEHVEMLGDCLAIMARDMHPDESDRYAIIEGLRKAMKRENLPIKLREIIIASLTNRIMSGQPSNSFTDGFRM